MVEQSHPWGYYLIAIISIVGIIWKFGNWTGKVNSALDELKSGLAKVNDNINKIFERLPPPKTAEAASPIKLTEFGKRISSESGVKQWASKHALDLLDKVKRKEEFEIFNFCVEYVNEQYEIDEELKRKIDATAYNNGIESEQVLMVYRIELRDHILVNAENNSD